jgi:hypothetical protein
MFQKGNSQRAKNDLGNGARPFGSGVRSCLAVSKMGRALFPADGPIADKVIWSTNTDSRWCGPESGTAREAGERFRNKSKVAGLAEAQQSAFVVWGMGDKTLTLLPIRVDGQSNVAIQKGNFLK